MNNMKRLLALVLAMMMVLCLCACGDEAGTNDDGSKNTSSTDNQSTNPEDPGNDEPDPVEYVYTVTVQDTEGNPIPNVFVQICAGETCVPKSTDEDGVAGYTAAVEGDGERTAKIINMPEGYQGEMEIVMGDKTDVVFVLAPVVDYVYTVTVQDTDGNPISGVFVQICAGTTCVPKSTDANGIAGYTSAVEGDGERSAKLINVPAGYAAVDGIMEISMADTDDVVFTLEVTE